MTTPDQASTGIAGAIQDHFASPTGPEAKSREEETAPAPETGAAAGAAPPATNPETGVEGGAETGTGAEAGGGDDLVTVIVDGEPVEVTRQELIDGYSRTEHFTRSMQSLADRERSIEAIRAALLLKEQEMAEQEKRRQAPADEVDEVDPEFAKVLTPLEKRMESKIAELNQRIAEVHGWRQEAEIHQATARAEGDLRAIVEEVKVKFPDVNTAVMAAVARDRIPRGSDGPRVKAVFMQVAREIDALDKKRVNAAVDAALKVKAPAAAGGPTVGAPAPAPPAAAANIADLVDRALGV